MERLIPINIKGFTIRFAEKEDTGLILKFIKGLAEYEKLSHEVIATEDILKESLFVKRAAEVIIGEYYNEPVGFALFFHNFSTFLGRPGLYLEDLFIIPEMRGKGFGKTMLSFLAKLAIDRNCGRLEWWCLDWNEPSIKFYKQLGAVPMDEYLKNLFYEIAKEKDFTIHTMEVMPDHVHIFVSAHPKISPSYIVKMLKGISARKLFIEYPELREQLYKGHLWNNSFYIETIGSISEDVIKKYIELQKERG